MTGIEAVERAQLRANETQNVYVAFKTARGEWLFNTFDWLLERPKSAPPLAQVEILSPDSRYFK